MDDFKTLLSDSEILKGTYPRPELIRNVFTSSNELERQGIIRLWMTEGIPFAFKDKPIIYEDSRQFIANSLKIHPKEVTLIGSARLGYSLTKKFWGREFKPTSDLDFTIISNDLFSRLVNDYQKWAGDFGERRIKPLSPFQMESWLKSIVTIDENIGRGYINTDYLFSHDNYSTVKKCRQTTYNLKKKLLNTFDAPKFSKLSFRVYSDWSNCIRQLKINFKTALELW